MPLSSEYSTQRYHQRRTDRLCVTCGTSLPLNRTTVLCTPCAVKAATSHKRNYLRVRQLNLCTRCHNQLDSDNQGVHCQQCREEHNAKSKIAHKQLREQIIQVYGGHCACCGEANIYFLTIDHVNNDGRDHRALLKGHSGFYQKLRIMGYPNNPPLQVLCWNCNMAKYYNGGSCPHTISDDQ